MYKNWTVIFSQTTINHQYYHLYRVTGQLPALRLFLKMATLVTWMLPLPFTVTKQKDNLISFPRTSKVGGGAYETVKTWRSLIGWVKDRLIGDLRDL